QRDAHAEPAFSALAPTGELRSLLAPDSVRPGEHPCRALADVVVPAADQRRVAVGGEGDDRAELALSALVRAGELSALLGPRGARAREPPGPALAAVTLVAGEHAAVVPAADQRGLAVNRKRDVRAEHALSGLAPTGELFAVLAPGGAREREHPRRALPAVIEP